MGKSWSSTIMEDKRIAVEEVDYLAGADAVMALPSSVAVGAGAQVGDVLVQQFTPEVQQTIGKLIESVDIVSTETIPTLMASFGDVITKTAGTFGQSLAAVSQQSSESLTAVGKATSRASELIGEKLQETQLGQASILPGMAAYLAIAVVAIIVVGKVWK